MLAFKCRYLEQKWARYVITLRDCVVPRMQNQV